MDRDEHTRFFHGIFIAIPLGIILWALIIWFVLLIVGCGGCKEQAIKDAHEMASQYETRIQVYEVLFTLPGYHSHAEAQVKTPEGWHFYRDGQVEDEPLKIRKVKNTCFTLPEFEALVAIPDGTFNYVENCGDKWPEPTAWDEAPDWLIWLIVILIIL